MKSLNNGGVESLVVTGVLLTPLDGSNHPSEPSVVLDDDEFLQEIEVLVEDEAVEAGADEAAVDEIDEMPDQFPSMSTNRRQGISMMKRLEVSMTKIAIPKAMRTIPAMTRPEKAMTRIMGRTILPAMTIAAPIRQMMMMTNKPLGLGTLLQTPRGPSFALISTASVISASSIISLRCAIVGVPS